MLGLIETGLLLVSAHPDAHHVVHDLGDAVGDDAGVDDDRDDRDDLADDQAGVAEVLGIPDGVTQAVMLPVAYLRGARLRPAERRDAREITYWERWGVARRRPDASDAAD